MQTTKWELCQLLIDCLKKDAPGVDTSRLSSLSPADWESFLALASTQRVSPLFWSRLKQKGIERTVPITAAETLKDVLLRNTMHNLRLYGELHQLLTRLKSDGIPLILLKGIFLAEAVYGDIGLREMNDIDVMAHPADLSRIAEILESMGYAPLQPVCVDACLKSYNHLPRMIKKNLASFEIHWNLTSPAERYCIAPEGLWERAVPVNVAGCSTLTLSPEDLLLHLCHHSSYHHQFSFGLRPSCDVAEIIARFGHDTLDWQKLAEQAAHWGWQRGVYLSLRLAVELAGADVPTDFLERLQPEDMTEAVLDTARAQVFTDKIFAVSISTHFAELLGKKSILDKIRFFLQRVFLTKAVIAAVYSTPSDSWRIYLCYPRRFVDLLLRHGHNLRKYQKDDASLKPLVDRKSLIANWLAQPTTATGSPEQASR